MKFRALVATKLLLAFLATSSPVWGDSWWNVDWRSRIKLTFDNSGQAQNLAAFPVLVVLDSSRIHYDRTQNQGEDIRFIDGGTGLPLDYEIEEWNEGGKSYVWVNVPQIDGSSNTDYIWLYYDHPSAVDGQNPSAVWTNGYVGVWHLREDPGPGNPGDIIDSTAANHHGTAEASMETGDLVGGQIGKALDFDGTNDFIDVGQNPSINIGGDLSVEFWLKTTATSTQGIDTPSNWFQGQRIVDKDVEAVPKGWGIANHYSKIKFNVEDNPETVVSTTTIDDDQWYYVAGVRDVDLGDKWLYINGTIDGATTSGSTADAASADPLQFARSDDGDPATYVQGNLDEIRVSNTERSADWVMAQYLSMTDAFISYGTGPVAFTSSRDGNPEIYVMDPDGSNQVRLTSHPNIDTNPAWSPDGRKIAFATDRHGTREIYVMDSDGFNLTRLTNNGFLDDGPAWSPDGKRIAFFSNRDGNEEIYVMSADGSGQANITNDPNIDVNPAWSPDGKQIVFTSRRDDNFEIYVMDDDGGNPVNLSNDPETDDQPTWSPDGSQIAFATYRNTTDFEIYVMGADGSTPTNLTNHGAQDEAPGWSPDGSKILFHTDRDTDVEIYAMNANGTNPINLTLWAGTDTDPAWGTAFGSFSFRKYITIDRHRIPGGCGPTISNYPMLYSVTDPDLKGKIPFGGKVNDPNGNDITFRALNDSTCGGAGLAPCKLDFEIETYMASTGELVAWVRLPSVYTSSAASDTVIVIEYGNEDISYPMQNPPGVWDANYVGVWHLNETALNGESVATHIDSTANANDGLQVKNATTFGKMANAQEFDGDDAIDMGDIDALDGIQKLTASAWVRLDALTDWGTVLAKGVDSTQSWGQKESAASQEGSDDVGVGVRDGDEDGWNTNNDILSTDGEFHLWTMVYDGTQSADADRLSFYFDGQEQTTVQAASGTVAPATALNNASFQVGNAPYGAFGLVGTVDEVRTSNIVRDACWIEANFKNIGDPGDIGLPGFYEVGNEAPLPPVLSLSSFENQIFVVGAAPTPAATITIKEDGLAGTITAANDLRIRIPAGFNMTWDTTVNFVILSGKALGKVDNVLLAYEDANQTAVLNVTTDFAPGDRLSLSGLAFTDFTNVSALDNLELDVDNDSIADATDDKTIEILETVVLTTTGVDTAGDGQLYTLNLAATHPIDSWTINWGDGSIETFAGNPSTVTHIYTGVGFTYNILASAVSGGTTYLQNELVVSSAINDNLTWYGHDAPTNKADVHVPGTIGPDLGLANANTVIIGPDGNIYVSGFDSNTVVRYNPKTGALIPPGFVAAGSGGLSGASGMAFGPDGHLYVASWGTSQVLRYNGTNGAFIDVFVTANLGGIDEVNLMTFGPDGDLYITDFKDSGTGNAVYRYDGTTGAFIDQFVASGSGTPALQNPEGLTFGPDGHLYVASDGNDAVYRFDGTTGDFMDVFASGGTLQFALGATFGPDGHLYVTSEGTNEVLRFQGPSSASPGTFIDDYVAAGLGGLDNPTRLTFIPEQQVTVVAGKVGAAISSATDQIFKVGEPRTPAAIITIADDDITPQIKAVSDIYIRIPPALDMIWDTGETTIIAGGSAASKVSTTVSYADPKTLIIDVTSDFATGESSLTLSGLAFKHFNSPSGPDYLELSIDGGNSAIDKDDKSITIKAPKVLKLIGFETGDPSELDFASVDAAINSGFIRPGSGTYYLVQETTPSDLVTGLSPSLNTFGLRFSFQKRVNGPQVMLQFKNGSTNLWALQLKADGSMEIVDSEGLNLGGTAWTGVPLTTNTWYTIRVVYNSAVDGMLQVWLDNSRVINLTHKNPGTGIDDIEITGPPFAPLNFFYDDFYLTDALVLPPMGQIVRISPVATTTGDFDQTVGTGAHEENADGDLNDGDHNWHLADSPATDLYELSASPAGKINAVKGMWRMKYEDKGDPGSHEFVWYEDGTTSSAGFAGITTLWSTKEFIWKNPPNSGGDWTTTKVDDLQLGASHNGAFGDDTYISWAAAMVDYDVTVTAVDLTYFTATGLDGEVLLEWETASEVDNLGFFLYRSESEAGPYTRINNEPVPGLLDSEAGARYRYVDSGLTNGTTYFYLLEDFETGGITKQHGPVSAIPEEGATSDSGEGPPISGETPAVITYGDPSLVSFKILEHGRRHMVLELITGGFYAELQDDGSVGLEIPGFVEESGPGVPAVPVKRSWVEAIAGRKVKVTSVEAYQVEAVSGLWPSNTTAPQIVVSGITVQAGRSPAEAQQAFAQAGLYPEETARVLSTGFQGEVKKALVELAPLRWDETAAELLLARRLVVRLSFTGREPNETSLGGSRGRQIRGKNLERNVVARLGVSDRGLYGVSYESVFGRRGRVVPSSVVRLSRQGEPVAYHLEPDSGSFARGSVLYFVSEGASLTPYAKQVVYELEVDSQGETMPVVSASPSGQSSSFYWHRVEREENRLFSSSAQTINRWTWGPIYASTSKSYPFDVNGLVSSGSEAGQLELSVQGFSKVPETEYRLRISINGNFVDEHSWSSDKPYDFTLDYPPALLGEGENQLTIENATGVHSGMLLDWFAVSHPRALSAVDGILKGRWSLSGVAAISDLGAQAHVLDVTEQPPLWMTGVVGSSRFRAEAGRSYLAVAEEAVLIPEVRISHAGSLKNLKEPVDYLVIGPRSFLSTAKPLLDLRHEQGLRSRAVSIEEVYDAFGYGESSPQALQEFLAYAYHHWPQPAPRYVLLVGDATYDFKDYLGTGTVNQVPPLQVRTSYFWAASDPTYAAVNGQDPFPDFAIGRLPASTVDELRIMVEKLVAYETGETSLSGPAVLIADNTDPGGNFEATAETLASGVLASQEPTKIYLGRLGIDAARSAVVEAFDQGASLMSYIGHGSINIWAQERVFESATVGDLLPQSQQPVVLTMNCYNGWFNIPYYDSLSEELVKAEGRGAIAAFSPSGLSLNAPAHWLHRALLEELLSGRHATLGDAVLAAQIDYAETGAFPELISIFHLFGDPALKLR